MYLVKIWWGHVHPQSTAAKIRERVPPPPPLPHKSPMAAVGKL